MEVKNEQSFGVFDTHANRSGANEILNAECLVGILDECDYFSSKLSGSKASE